MNPCFGRYVLPRVPRGDGSADNCLADDLQEHLDSAEEHSEVVAEDPGKGGIELGLASGSRVKAPGSKADTP